MILHCRALHVLHRVQDLEHRGYLWVTIPNRLFADLGYAEIHRKSIWSIKGGGFIQYYERFKSRGS